MKSLIQRFKRPQALVDWTFVVYDEVRADDIYWSDKYREFAAYNEPNKAVAYFQFKETVDVV
jgi:hypothetical protein